MTDWITRCAFCQRAECAPGADRAVWCGLRIKYASPLPAWAAPGTEPFGDPYDAAWDGDGDALTQRAARRFDPWEHQAGMSREDYEYAPGGQA